MAKKKLTPLQVMYKKEVDRLKRAVRRAEKKGYLFDEDVIPVTPKRITKKALEKIQNYKTPNIYKKAVKVDFETGEFERGLEARKKERSEAAKKGHRKDKPQPIKAKPQEPILDLDYVPISSTLIIANFRFDIHRFPELASPLLEEWLDKMINKYGENDVANMLEEAKNRGIWITPQIAYDYNLLTDMISEMINFLPEMTIQGRADLMDAIEYGEFWDTSIED